MFDRLMLWIDHHPERFALYGWMVTLALLSLVGFMAATGAQEPDPRSFTIGIEQPTDGTKYALLCQRIESIQLVEKPDLVWGGLPTWGSVKGSGRTEACPPSQGNWIEIPTELHRNYQVSLRLVRYDESGEVISSRDLSPYFWFESGMRPSAPVILSV